MGKILSKSKLAIVLSKLEGFKNQKVIIEQYDTDSEVAATVLWDAYMKGHLDGKVADMGCGTGILGLGALILGAKEVFMVENDDNALNIAKNNYEKLKSEGWIVNKAHFVLLDIADFNEQVDIVIENPPFGVKVKHADRVFIEKAMKISPIIYSLHKSESKDFIEAFSRDNGFMIKEELRFSYPLKQTLKFHKKKIHYFNVSCFILERR